MSFPTRRLQVYSAHSTQVAATPLLQTQASGGLLLGRRPQRPGPRHPVGRGRAPPSVPRLRLGDGTAIAWISVLGLRLQDSLFIWLHWALQIGGCILNKQHFFGGFRTPHCQNGEGIPAGRERPPRAPVLTVPPSPPPRSRTPELGLRGGPRHRHGRLPFHVALARTWEEAGQSAGQHGPCSGGRLLRACRRPAGWLVARLMVRRGPPGP